jgi:hypothetical protein
MSRNTALLVTLVIVLTAGCGQVIDLDAAESQEASIQASVVSPPDDATVIDYNSSELDDKPGIKDIVERKVRFYKEAGIESDTYPINSSMLEDYRALDSGYIRYRGVVVRLALSLESERLALRAPS